MEALTVNILTPLLIFIIRRGITLLDADFASGEDTKALRKSSAGCGEMSFPSAN
jgi:hypothetical protein